MRIVHPETRQVADVDEDSYEFVFKKRGWEPAEAPPSAETIARVAEAAQTQTVEEILTAVGEDPHLALSALQVEQAGRQRKTLIAALERIAYPEPPIPDGSPTEAPAADSTEENQA